LRIETSDGDIGQIIAVIRRGNLTGRKEHNLFDQLESPITGAGRLTGEPGPAQYSEFQKNLCWKVPALGFSWSSNWVKKPEPVVLEATPAAGSEDPSPTGGSKRPRCRNWFSAVALATSSERAEKMENLMMPTVQQGQLAERGRERERE
jgi:hypothetical protein